MKGEKEREEETKKKNARALISGIRVKDFSRLPQNYNLV